MTKNMAGFSKLLNSLTNKSTRIAVSKILRSEYGVEPSEAWSVYKMIRNWAILFVLSVEATAIAVSILSH